MEGSRGHRLERLDLRGREGFGINCLRFGSENENLILSRIHDYVLHGYGHNLLERLGGRFWWTDWDKELVEREKELMLIIVPISYA